MTSDSTEQNPLPDKFSFDDLRFKRVEVVSSGILYRGVLIGADESDIFLKGNLRWLILPLERVSSVRLDGQKQEFNPIKQVPPGFYSDPVSEDS